MIGFDARYFDGRTTTPHPVRGFLAAGSLRVVGAEVDRVAPLAAVRVVRSIDGARCILRLPEGAQVETTDTAAIQAAWPAEARRDWVRRLEANWTAALAAVALTGAAVAWAWLVGVPRAAETLAQRAPPEWQEELGRQTLATLDSAFCEPTALEPGEQHDIATQALAVVLKGMPNASRYRLEFRDCESLGPNAFALPEATIVVTDELVDLAEGDMDRLAAVLAHEVGHAELRHPMRMSLQAAGVAILVAAVASDAVSITNLAAILPTVLLESGYSRAFEEEADDFALKRLAAVGIPKETFIAMLEALEKAHGQEDAGSRDYLSTHPSTRARIERAKAFGP